MYWKNNSGVPPITQRSATEPKAAGPVRSTRVILERHLADKMLDLPNFSMSI